MHSLNTLDFVSDFVSHFVSHFVSDQYQRGISLKKHFQIASKPLNDRMVRYHNRPSPDLTRQEAVIVHSISNGALLQNLFKPRHHPFFLEVMVLGVYIGVIEISSKVYAFGNLVYLLTVFGVGILLIMIVCKVVGLSCYLICLTNQVEIAVDTAFGTYYWARS